MSSLVFLLGTDTEIQSGKTAADVAAKTGGLVLIEDQERQKFLKRAGELHIQPQVITGTKGFDYSRGRREHITVYRVAKP